MKKVALVVVGPTYFVGELDQMSPENSPILSITLKKVYVLQIIVEGSEASGNLKYSTVGVPFVCQTMTFINPAAYSFLSEDSPLYKFYVQKTSEIVIPDSKNILNIKDIFKKKEGN